MDPGINPGRALIPAPGDAEKVKTGFWRKIARTAAKIPFATDAIAIFFATKDPRTPKKTKAMMLAGLAYFVTPVDAIPDIFAGVGFTDDAAVIAALIALAGSSIRPRHRKAARDWLDRQGR